MVSLKVHVRKNFTFGVFALFVLLLMSSPGQASVQASLDRENVYQGESFTLTITSDAAQGEMPDLTLLEKDFKILGSGSSRQFQIINGATTARTSWNIQLQAKENGQFLIPSLRVGKQLTNPIQVTVSEPPEASNVDDGQHIFIELEVESGNKPIYLQQQILYTVRLIFDQPILEGTLSDPVPENALVEQLGKNKRYSSQRNGRPFTVIERRYAIFPEKSGQLIIPPLRFQGSLVSNTKRSRSQRNIDPMMERFFGGDPFARMQDQGRPVTVQSKQISLDVLPRPASFSSRYWLPAAGLELIDSWAEQPPEFKVGEPVTRTLSINAKGLLATLLPKLEITDVDGVSIYPEQPETETRTDGTWVYGISKQNMSYMPTKAGQLIIPELQLNWWDTTADVERKAVLPKWTVEVLPGTGSPEVPAVQAEAKSQIDEQPEATAIEVNKSSDAIQEVPWAKQIQKHWQWSLLILVMLILSVFWLRRKNRGKNAAGEQKKPEAHDKAKAHIESQRQLKLRLQKACSENDASSTAEILLAMAAIAIPEKPPKTLPALASILESGGEDINHLDRFLYARNDAQWNGECCYKFFKDGLLFKAPEKKGNEALAPLYPT